MNNKWKPVRNPEPTIHQKTFNGTCPNCKKDVTITIHLTGMLACKTDLQYTYHVSGTSCSLQHDNPNCCYPACSLIANIKDSVI